MKPAVAGLPRVAAGLLDQALVACANAGTTIVALALLSRERAGGLVLSLGLGYLVLTLNRAFVGDVLVTMASRLQPEQRARLVRGGLATAALVGFFATVVLLGVWVLRPRTGDIDLQDLVWLAPFLPAVLLHDTGRSSYLANSAQSSALVIDLVWVGTQAVLIAALALAGIRGGGVILGCWGGGALAGSVVFLARTRAWPWRGDPRRFAVQTRHLSGWFTATQVIGQLQVQAVAFLVGLRFSASQLSGLRGGQTALIQPVQNFNMAVQALIVPRLSPLAGDAARLAGTDRQDAAAALRRQTRLLAAAFTGMAVLLVAIMVPLAHLVLAHLSKFADIAPLALPLSVQAGIYLVELPFAAALRGMHRARLLFVRYLIYTGSSLAGLVLGAEVDGLRAAVWGLTVGAAVSLVTMISFYALAARQLSAQDVVAGLVIPAQRTPVDLVPEMPVGRSAPV